MFSKKIQIELEKKDDTIHLEPIRKIKLDDEYLPSSEEIKNYRDKLIALNTYIEDESQES